MASKPFKRNLVATRSAASRLIGGPDPHADHRPFHKRDGVATGFELSDKIIGVLANPERSGLDVEPGAYWSRGYDYRVGHLCCSAWGATGAGPGVRT